MKKCYIELSALYHYSLYTQAGRTWKRSFSTYICDSTLVFYIQFFIYSPTLGENYWDLPGISLSPSFIIAFCPIRAPSIITARIFPTEREYIFWKEKKTEDKIESLESVNNFWNLFLIINVNFMKETVSRDLYALNFFLSHYTNPFGSLFDKYFAKIFNAKVRIFYSSMSLSTWSEKFRLR